MESGAETDDMAGVALRVGWTQEPTQQLVRNRVSWVVENRAWGSLFK